MLMRSIQSHPWGLDTHEVGHEFEASDDEVSLLLVLGWAEPTEVAPAIPVRRGPGRPPKVRDMQPAHAAGYITK